MSIRTLTRRACVAVGTVGVAGLLPVVAADPVAGTTPPPPTVLTGATATSPDGTVYCDSKGYFDNGRLSVELSGYANASDRTSTAAINVTCELRQGGTTQLRTSRTCGGASCGTFATGSIPLAPTRVCASGFVVPTDGSANRPIPTVCTSS